MPANGTQKGDVYSFAIIAQEVVYRRGPFYIPNSHFSARGTAIHSLSPEHASLLLKPLFITQSKALQMDTCEGLSPCLFFRDCGKGQGGGL